MLFKSSLVTALLLSAIPSFVAAHGRMVSPPIRLKPGDQNNGFDFAKGPNTRQPCGGLVRILAFASCLASGLSNVQANFQPGAQIPIKWQITAAHKGPCFIELSTDGRDGNFKTLKTLPNCAETNGDFSDSVSPGNVQCDKCTLRFRWQAKLTGETYINCADISIGGKGGAAQQAGSSGANNAGQGQAQDQAQGQGQAGRGRQPGQGQRQPGQRQPGQRQQGQRLPGQGQRQQGNRRVQGGNRRFGANRRVGGNRRAGRN
ncbi:uncharacterized protein VTP21DRAFT_7114 [Calcarisporiella thermophila]|uniref:uncharacterized protein n=1 Tax=Calcarisporiella thermophila TaxID=911321 RepID=UPI00374211A5